jgi:single-stranded DNA-binding protein
MGRTRIELSGRLVKPPMLGATPSGRAVLRLSVDCGEEPEHLLLDVVLVNETARDLARMLSAGEQVRVVGALKALRRSPAAVAARERVEVIAVEVAPEYPGRAPRRSGFGGGEADSVTKRIR